MSIVEFLEARITEDETAAREAIEPERPGSHWQWVTNETDTPVAHGDLAEAQEYQRISLRTVEEFPTSAGMLPSFPIEHAEQVAPGAGEHIARHNPARVLAECKAKRAIIRQWDDVTLDEGVRDEDDTINEIHSGLVMALRDVLKVLAAVYSDHPDYDPEWRHA